MNQSMGANSFEKSSLECTDVWQQESANELWKASYSSSQTVQNTNQVYENLLRICEEIDAALPEIQSTVNKGGLHINEHKFLPENRILQDPFMQNFDDTGTSLEDIEIYEDILSSSAIMWNNDYKNFDFTKTNQIVQRDISQSLTEQSRYNSETCFRIQPTMEPLLDERPIFAENEIEQYLMNKSFNFNSHNFPNTSVHQDAKEEVEDSLQLWHKLNCNAVEKKLIEKPEEDDSNTALDLSVKPSKSVLAIFDFTMPSLSSSASSSPEQRDIDIETSTHPPVENKSQKKCDSGLPILVGQEIETNSSNQVIKKRKKKKKSSKKKSIKLVRQDLILSSSSEDSASSPVPGKTSHKKIKLERPKPDDEKSLLKDDTKNKKKHTKKSTDLSNTKSNISPTLRAGAAYIEQQFNTSPVQKSTGKVRPSDSIPHKYFAKKDILEKSTRLRNSKEDDKRYKTRLSSKPTSSPAIPQLPSSSNDENNNQRISSRSKTRDKKYHK